MSESGNNLNPNLRTTATTEQRHGLRGFIGTKTGKATVAGAVLLTAAVVFGIVQANEGHTSPAQQKAAATAPANTPKPIETITFKDSEMVASPISAEKYTTPEAVVRASVVAVDNWINAGGTEANSKAWNNTDNAGKYFTDLMMKSNTQYESQLLITNWRDVSSLSAYVPNKEDVHKKTTTLNFLTTPNNPDSEYNAENKEAYKRGQVVDSIQIVSADSAKLIADITVHEYDNSDKNAVLKYTKGVAIDTAPYKIKMTLTNVEGNWKLSDYSE